MEHKKVEQGYGCDKLINKINIFLKHCEDLNGGDEHNYYTWDDKNNISSSIKSDTMCSSDGIETYSKNLHQIKQSYDTALRSLKSDQHYSSSQGQRGCISPDSLMKLDECSPDEHSNDKQSLMSELSLKEPFNLKLNERVTENLKYQNTSQNAKHLKEFLEDTSTKPLCHQNNRLLFLDYLLKSEENFNKRDEQNVRCKTVRRMLHKSHIRKRCHMNIINRKLFRLCKVNNEIRHLNEFLNIKKINPINRTYTTSAINSNIYEKMTSSSTSVESEEKTPTTSSDERDQSICDSFSAECAISSMRSYSPDSLESRRSQESVKDGCASEHFLPHRLNAFSDYTMLGGHYTNNRANNEKNCKIHRFYFNNNLPVSTDENKYFQEPFFPIYCNNLENNAFDINDQHCCYKNRQELTLDTVKPVLSNTYDKLSDSSDLATQKSCTLLIAEDPYSEAKDFSMNIVGNRLISKVDNIHLTSVTQSISLKHSLLLEQPTHGIDSQQILDELAMRQKGSKLLLDHSQMGKSKISEKLVDQAGIECELSLDDTKIDESSVILEDVEQDMLLIEEDITSSIKLNQVLKKARNLKNNQNMKKKVCQRKLQNKGPFVCKPSIQPTLSLQLDDFSCYKRRHLKHFNFSKSSLIHSCKKLIQRTRNNTHVISNLPLTLTKKTNDPNDYISAKFHKLGLSDKFRSERSQSKWAFSNTEYSKRFVKSSQRTKNEKNPLLTVTCTMNARKQRFRMKTTCGKKMKDGELSTRCNSMCPAHEYPLARNAPEENFNTRTNQYFKNYVHLKHKKSISKYNKQNLETKNVLKVDCSSHTVGTLTYQSNASVNVRNKSKPILCDRSKAYVNLCDKSQPFSHVCNKSKQLVHSQVSDNRQFKTIQMDPCLTKQLNSRSTEHQGDKDVFSRLTVSHPKCIGDISSLCCLLLKEVSDSSYGWQFTQDDIKYVWVLTKQSLGNKQKPKQGVENSRIRCISRNKNISDINRLKRVVACIKALINHQNIILKGIEDTIQLLQHKEDILDPIKSYDIPKPFVKEIFKSKQCHFKRKWEKKTKVDNIDIYNIDSSSSV